MNLLPVLHHQQQHSADCLPTCVAMALAYLQVPIYYDRLCKLLRFSPNGTPFRNLRYVESLGMSVRIGNGDLDQVRAILNDHLPVIIPVDTSELQSYWTEATDHAVLVIGIDTDFVYVLDPAMSAEVQAVPLAEFELAWLAHDYLYGVVALV